MMALHNDIVHAHYEQILILMWIAVLSYFVYNIEKN